jgi:uncharacterized protein YjaG (DUF416 family)
MIRPFNDDDVSALLHKLDDRKKTAFIASCAERLFGFYQAFVLEEGVGDHDALRKIIDRLWDWSAGAIDLDGQEPFMREALDHLYPDPERVFFSVFTEMASYACEVTEVGLDIISRSRTCETTAVDGSIITQTAVELYLALVNQVFLRNATIQEQQIQSKKSYCEFPLFQAELQKQSDDCILLSQTHVVSSVIIAQLRNFAGVEPVRRFHLDRPHRRLRVTDD